MSHSFISTGWLAAAAITGALAVAAWADGASADDQEFGFREAQAAEAERYVDQQDRAQPPEACRGR